MKFGFLISFFLFCSLGEEYESDESTSDINDENPSSSDENSFSYDGPMVIRHDYKATKSTRNTSR